MVSIHLPPEIRLQDGIYKPPWLVLTTKPTMQIDFNAVGQATNLKSPAARMRYTRLRRQIEGGTLIGTHGTPFSGVAGKMSPEMRKRTGVFQPEFSDGEKTTSLDRKIKSEPEEFSDRYETDYSEEENSEDEMPLAKRRYDRLKLGDASSESASVAIIQPGFMFGFRDGQDNPSPEPNTQLNISQGRPEIHENYLTVVPNSNSNTHLYLPADRRFDINTQPLEGNEDPRHS